ncbi:MAG: hypothetical protein KKB21_03575 [Nanoarchaeota archaeon]|nr:hypothetical protein [Nanoarchaeota archaeon]MBU4086628.1 hypothetical protein [Nanoarchaeota archaeon]
MSWFTKKQEKPKLTSLPELPALPDLPRQKITEDFSPSISPLTMPMPTQREEIHSLPSFPNSETANKMSREAIKSALANPPKTKPYTQEIESPGQFREEDEEDSRREFDEDLSSITPPRVRDSSEPIFVRIDKFQSAVKSIVEIRKQITEIEAYLSEIRKLKAKEEEELQEWEHEILGAKSKLDNVDKILFGKL